MSHEEQFSLKKNMSGRQCNWQGISEGHFSVRDHPITCPRQHPLMNNPCSWILLVFSDWHHEVKRSKDITGAEREAETSLVINVPTVAKVSVLFSPWLPKSDLHPEFKFAPSQRRVFTAKTLLSSYLREAVNRTTDSCSVRVSSEAWT